MYRTCDKCGHVTDQPEGGGGCPTYHGRTGDGYCPLFVDGLTREEQRKMGTNGGPPIDETSSATMDERTLTALRGSVEKWRRIERGEDVDRGSENCPLCQEFIDDRCAGCPVRAATGQAYCGGTPHKRWVHLGGHLRSGTHSAELAALAREEREFLESLLPIEEKKEDTQ